MEWTTIRRALGHAVQGWLYDPNVTLVDYGYQRKEGRLLVDEAPCIRVHVREKFDPIALEMAVSSGRTSGPVPGAIGGIKVDVTPGDYRTKLGTRSPLGVGARGRSRWRAVDPLAGGVSTSDAARPIAGTLGGIVTDRASGQPMFLSNWHVLVGLSGRIGQHVRQPGNADGATEADTIGVVVRHAMNVNLDAAVASVTGARATANQQYDLWPVRGAAVAQLGTQVVKSGRTSGVTRGLVTGVEGMPRIPYGWMGQRVIRHVATIEPIDGGEVSEPGDSGSFWIDEATRNVVGLHFAGNTPRQPEEAMMIDIVPVLDALAVDLLV